MGGSSQDIVRDAAHVFGSEKKRKNIGNPSIDTASELPFVGRMVGPSHPQQHRIRGPTEPPAQSEKRKPSCGFGGSMMSNGAHCRVNNGPRVKAIGIFLKGTTQSDLLTIC
jgi:hypothetical protein